MINEICLIIVGSFSLAGFHGRDLQARPSQAMFETAHLKIGAPSASEAVGRCAGKEGGSTAPLNGADAMRQHASTRPKPAQTHFKPAKPWAVQMSARTSKNGKNQTKHLARQTITHKTKQCSSVLHSHTSTGLCNSVLTEA